MSFEAEGPNSNPEPIEMDDGTLVTPTGDGYEIVYPGGEEDSVEFPADGE